MVELHQSLGPKYILTLVDHFSKFGKVWSMSSKEAAGIIEKLDLFFARHGKPEILQSDNGREFVNSAMAKFAQQQGIKQSHGQPYHPQS
jgi:transposase InsO family protein